MKNTEKSLRKFLRERNLLKSYNRYVKIPRKRRLNVTIDGSARDVAVFKKKNKTIIADFLTLKTLAATKRFNTQNIEKAFIKKPFLKQREGEDYARTIYAESRYPVKFSEIARVPLKKFDESRRKTPLKKMLGKLVIRVTFIKGKKHKTVTGASRRPKNLSIKRRREQAFDEAFIGALSQIKFSYDTFFVNWEQYHYFIKKSPKRAAGSFLSID